LGGGSVALLLNAVIALGLLSAFAVIYLFDRSQRAPLWLCLSYALGLITAGIEFLMPGLENPDFGRDLVFLTFSASLVALIAGLRGIYAPRHDLTPLFFLVAFFIFLNVGVSQFPRDSFGDMIIRQGAYALIHGYAIIMLMRHVRFGLAEYSLMAAIMFNMVQYLMRPSIAILSGGTGSGAQDFLSTQYATVIMVIFAVGMVWLSFTLLGISLVRLGRALKVEAFEDVQTGLLNRRGLEHGIDVLRNTGRRNSFAHAVIIADIDRFKAINDRYGHIAGDAVITAFGRVVSQMVGDDCLASRYGGEEFVIILPNTPVESARLFAEGLRSAFSAIAHPELDGEQVTASFGVGWWNGDEPIRTALRSADRALYRAKEGGRDRVLTTSDRPEIPDQLKIRASA